MQLLRKIGQNNRLASPFPSGKFWILWCNALRAVYSNFKIGDARMGGKLESQIWVNQISILEVSRVPLYIRQCLHYNDIFRSPRSPSISQFAVEAVQILQTNHWYVTLNPLRDIVAYRLITLMHQWSCTSRCTAVPNRNLINLILSF